MKKSIAQSAVRKMNFLEQTWFEYTQLILKFIPKNIRNRLFTRKAVYLTVAVIVCEIAIATSIYFLYFQGL